MNLSINTTAASMQSIAALSGTEAASKAVETRPATNGLTITNREAASGEISAASIPDAALARDDALGKLFSSAFTLPAPPMPEFS